MRISDWSSDVCSSDLVSELRAIPAAAIASSPAQQIVMREHRDHRAGSGQAQLGVHCRRHPDIGQIQFTDHGPRRRGEHTGLRSEEHTSELQSLMRISYAVFCLKKKKHKNTTSK